MVDIFLKAKGMRLSPEVKQSAVFIAYNKIRKNLVSSTVPLDSLPQLKDSLMRSLMMVINVIFFDIV